MHIRKVMFDDFEQSTCIENKQKRPKTGTLWDAVLCMELGRCLAVDGDRLKSVAKIGVEPGVGLP